VTTNLKKSNAVMDINTDSTFHENDSPELCSHCLMSRLRFARSRVIITLEIGTTIESCMVSHGLVIQGQAIKRIKVTEYNSKKLIEAKSAFWIINQSRQCPMSTIELWAFADEQSAQAYLQKHTGTLCTWEEALKAACDGRLVDSTRKISSRFSDNKRTAPTAFELCLTIEHFPSGSLAGPPPHLTESHAPHD
jgi:hypothetical protein